MIAYAAVWALSCLAVYILLGQLIRKFNSPRVEFWFPAFITLIFTAVAYWALYRMMVAL